MNTANMPLPDEVVEDPKVYYKGLRCARKVEALSYLLSFTHKNYDCESFSIHVTGNVDRTKIKLASEDVRNILRRWNDLHIDPKYCPRKSMRIWRDTDIDYINVELTYRKLRKNAKASKKQGKGVKRVRLFQMPAENLEELLTLVSTRVRSMK